MTGSEIRAKFFDYFQKKGHTLVESSNLIPRNDPTLLFTNAGMNQFKDTFLGLEKREYVRGVSSQKCVRAGGKHNDLENVGRTARHHTFFEMLGNFSFGDYFKKDAIAFAWEFLTVELGLSKERLYVTVYQDDDEAAAIWHEQQGVPVERIYRFGEKDNFWSMGDTGPCGPCTEIFWDNGPGTGCGTPECAVGCDCDRYMEIWNNVFMQFNRDQNGVLNPLPKPSVDTGMGLERVSAIMQGVTSNYDTDLLQGIIRHIETLAGKKYRADQKDDVSMRVMADHARAITFLICDGVLPSNEGRGYVLRRIMRRAARHAKMLGISEPVLYRIVDAVNLMMADAYPELLERELYVKKVIHAEEMRFAETLDRGLAILNEETARLQGLGERLISGEVIFKLYDTFGFPVDLTADIVQAEGFILDEEGFALCMDRQRMKAREHWKGSGEEGLAPIYKELHAGGHTCSFIGYTEHTAYSPINAIIAQGVLVEEAALGDEVEIVTASTPFYGESGGQAGDTGTITTSSGHLEVTATVRPFTDLIVHRGKILSGNIRTGERANLQVSVPVRVAAARNHTATHLLQAALREVLGDHVKQAGSLVTPDRLRFDFTHFLPMTPAELHRVETLVNSHIMANAQVESREMPAAQAQATGATALFGEKYGDLVRVVMIGEVSRELCGGTHVLSTGEIGLFKIISEVGIAAGVRRIEAQTGGGALAFVHQIEEELSAISQLLKAEGGTSRDKVEKLLANQREVQKEREGMQARLNAAKSLELIAHVREQNGIRILAVKVEGGEAKGLRELSDTLKERIGSGVIVLGTSEAGKANLLVAVTSDLTARWKAGEIIKAIAPIVGGRGGGKPELAQAGGCAPEHLDEALEAVYRIIG
jgi:alanyl-tRNA synthetase